MQEMRFDPWIGKTPLEKEMVTHSSILAWRIPWNLVGYNPWGGKESDRTYQLDNKHMKRCPAY